MGSCLTTIAVAACAALAVGVNENLQLDFGALVGLSDAAEDFSIYPGFTLRF